MDGRGLRVPSARAYDTYTYMIVFRCRCSHQFSVPDDQAGATVQCPHCGLLCDVPRLGEIPTLEEDGTIRLEDSPVVAEPHRLAQLDRAFARRRVDEQGHDIDLRPTLDQIKHVGAPPPTPRQARRLTAPRYDPETGELITPLEVVQSAAPQEHSIPLAAPVLNYSRLAAPTTLTGPAVLVRMFWPANIAVILIIFASYLVAWGLGSILVYIFALAMVPYSDFALLLPFVPLCLLIIGHYGNVIDETGREDKDQLPRPLRDLRWHEDLWGSFASMAAGIILCFWPMAAIALGIHHPHWRQPALWAALLGGLIFIPAVWLTVLSSSSYENLRPDRVLNVILTCGVRYFLLPVILIAALAAHAWAAVVSGLIPASWMPPIPAWLFEVPYAAALLLLIGTYLLHFFGWYLGILYSRRHDSFRWAWQRFEK